MDGLSAANDKSTWITLTSPALHCPDYSPAAGNCSSLFIAGSPDTSCQFVKFSGQFVKSAGHSNWWVGY